MTIDQNDPRMRAVSEAYNRRDLAKTASLLESLLVEYPDDVDLLYRLGVVAAQRGQSESAIAYLERGRKIEPKNVHILYMLAMAHKNIFKRDEAQQFFEKVIKLEPKIVEAHIELGDLHFARGNTESARRCFEKALAIQPDFITALVNLASLNERAHRFEEAHALASRAVQHAPAHGQANVTLALVELRMGRTQQAVQRLESLLKNTSITAVEAASAKYLIGQAMNKQGEYDKAFIAYEGGNTDLHRLYEASVASMSSVLSPNFLPKIHKFFAATDISTWTKPEKVEEPTPVFLLGFPRSGTTLLDQMLKTHSAITTLEENENLIDARNDLIRPPDALEKLGAMTSDDINRYRKKYWSLVRKELKKKSRDGVIIDKMPLNTILLGLIYRLFPGAKIIFAIRDPRDVVLSCFQQRFGINVAMFQLLKLETAAAYYDQVMGISDVCRARLPINLHIIRYEDVVGDMQNTVSDVLRFLGLEWEDAILDYRAQARNRYISTPSAEQVIEPLYKSSIGKWRNYARYMEPVLPVLEPWVKKYGYDAS